ncbi:MAG: SDR family oxidoreductase [Cyanobacteria bacterium P01_C01_bin.72]
MMLKEKVALIVGIKDSIGSSTAEMMAEAGAKVAIADRNVERGTALVEKITAAGGEAIFLEMDVTLNRSQAASIQRIVEEYGRLDIAFNNVSIDGDSFPLTQQSEIMVAGVIDVNFNGMWLSLKYQIEQMLKNGGGVIVNNVCSLKADGSPGCSIYRATKSAVLTMSQVAAMEYSRKNIRINTISPGMLKQSPSQVNEDAVACNPAIVPMNRTANPQEIAQAVVWLCSDRASYITGQTLAVDGGLSALSLG